MHYSTLVYDNHYQVTDTGWTDIKEQTGTACQCTMSRTLPILRLIGTMPWVAFTHVMKVG